MNPLRTLLLASASGIHYDMPLAEENFCIIRPQPDDGLRIFRVAETVFAGGIPLPPEALLGGYVLEFELLDICLEPAGGFALPEVFRPEPTLPLACGFPEREPRDTSRARQAARSHSANWAGGRAQTVPIYKG